MSEKKNLESLLVKMNELGASDLHLNHNNRIAYRVDGSIVQTDQFIKGSTIFKLLMDSGAISSDQATKFHNTHNIEFSYAFSGNRYRGSLYKAREEYGCVIRRVSDRIIPIDEIGLPRAVKSMLNSPYGLILITGPTGSGKTTTLASIIDHLNNTKYFHIGTIEEPIEVVFKSNKSIITQREVGKDTPSFASAMVNILRRDPDVIMVGEMRDLETISTAITASETGHLVFGTLHTNTAASSISRIIDVFPEGQHHHIRSQMANNLRMIINQRLVPKVGGGRIPMYEVMVVNTEMRMLIRSNELDLLEDVMARNRKAGNVLMRDSYNMAKQRGEITQEW